MDKKESSEKTITLTSTGKTAQTIGPYQLLQKVGEGGMGEVWIAEQHKPIHRRVALKLIKAGMDTRQVIARFESERQALAMMDHPAIAKVFEAGETAQGRPYFVMEYVQGIPITTYCDQNRLTNTERLGLFIHVCDGVQHAHQKAIIHRDLKPSNILVAIQDGKPVPKIIDFGVAKATARSLTERTMYTELGTMIGTPEYMSPEQAEMTGQNVDTRTDIYSLGAILYELLIGALPFDPKELRRAGFDEIRRKIREEDPPKPSTKLSTMGEISAIQAQNRRTERPALIRQIRGDLDWITMKALEKDRTRRYGSPMDLAADIDRYLHHQPIIARPPSTFYKARKFVRRHRVGVGVASSLVFLLVAFSVTTALQARRIARERDRANKEAETSNQVSDFLVNLFEVSDPGEARGKTVTAREILDRGAEKIDEELADQPLTQARLQATIGRVYNQLGFYEESLALHKKALDTRQKMSGNEHLDVAISLGAVGDLYRKLGKHKEAEPYLKEALEVRERLLGSDHPDIARSLNNLAVLYENTSRYADAEPLYKRALLIQEKELGSDDPDLSMILTNLAILMARQGKYAESEPIFERALSIDEKALGPDHPKVGTDYNNLAITYKLQKKYKEAEPMYRRALEIREKVLGSNHPDVARTYNNLANLYLEQERFRDAEPLYRRALKISEEALGPEHPDVGLSLDNLGLLCAKEGRYAEADASYRRALKIREKAFGPEHHLVANSLHNLANLLRDRSRNTEAEPLYQRSLSIYRKLLDPKHPDLLGLVKDFAACLRSNGREAEASALETEFGKETPLL